MSALGVGTDSAQDVNVDLVAPTGGMSVAAAFRHVRWAVGGVAPQSVVLVHPKGRPFRVFHRSSPASAGIEDRRVIRVGGPANLSNSPAGTNAARWSSHRSIRTPPAVQVAEQSSHKPFTPFGVRHTERHRPFRPGRFDPVKLPVVPGPTVFVRPSVENGEIPPTALFVGAGVIGPPGTLRPV